jgi:tRNA A-37 threonylcarbamoyl transferase component Bud32
LLHKLETKFSYNTIDILNGPLIHWKQYLISLSKQNRIFNLFEYGESKSNTNTLNCNSSTSSPSPMNPVVWDSNTIGFISFNAGNTQVCHTYNTGSDPVNLYNISIMESAIKTDFILIASEYVYAFKIETTQLIQLKKQYILNETIGEKQLNIELHDTTVYKQMQLFSNESLILVFEVADQGSYKLLNTKLHIIGFGTLQKVSNMRSSFVQNNILHLVNSEGSIYRYQYNSEKILPRTDTNIKRRRIAAAVICSVTIGIILMCLTLIILGFLRGSYRRIKIQKEIEMRLLTSEVPIDPSLSEEDKFKKKTVVIPIQDLKFGKRVSEGANGVVYRGTWKKTDVAIKRIKATDDIDAFIQECAILNSMRHMNVVLFLGISQDDGGNRYIVTEFVENGSIDNLIYNDKLESNQILSFSEKVRILKQVCGGMIYLHSMNPPIIHRDLKPQNILLTKTLDAKICDFGVSKYCIDSIMTGVQYGTVEYCPPEILRIEDQESAVYDEKCDVYSFGIIMHEIFFMVKPYQPLSKASQMRINLFTLGQNVLKGKRPDIPFDLDNESDMLHWFTKCHKRAVNEFNAASVRKYFEVCRECWSESAVLRPSFDSLYDRLAELSD